MQSAAATRRESSYLPESTIFCSETRVKGIHLFLRISPHKIAAAESSVTCFLSTSFNQGNKVISRSRDFFRDGPQIGRPCKLGSGSV